MGISVSMITFNEEVKLEKTLKSVYKWVDEIIIVDSHSTDKTVDIAKKFGAKVYCEEWKGFGKQKNSALEKCTQDWILVIDADEEITKELAEEILLEVRKPKGNVYKIPRISYCFGKKTRHKDFAIRLVKNKIGKYNNKEVHENFESEEKIFKLKNNINHYTYTDLKEYLEKFNKYTSLAAIQMFEKGKNINIFILILNPFYKFIKKYIFKLAFLDGKNGFLLSILSAYYNLIKYAKLWELKENE
ncbi:MAG: hypothetical protein B6I28_00700 [Fusobacteriia bacterium 4572_132]|nr:MAG: hypothetical protein B6I28_00700 [Fusobacteriia bacterium 4572_132]